MKMVLWAGVIIASLAIGIFGYAVGRYCNRQKEWSEQTEAVGQNNCDSNGIDVAQDAEADSNGNDAAPYAEDDSNGSAVAQDAEDESNMSDTAQDAEDGDNGYGQDEYLCVICLTRRRIVAFIPCGHLVCCQLCVFSFGWQLEPKCPVCRHPIWNSVRIYES